MSLPARDRGSTGEQDSLSRHRGAEGLPKLDKYELIEELGHGGMATVYRARDPRLRREVAVKIIHKHLRENAEVGARFVAEARAAAKLRHPGIVEVYDVSSEQDGERYLVVELLRGSTLRKILSDHREMPAEIGAAVVLELCEALEHAHASGIIHRDVKPENVLVELPSDRVASWDGEGVVIKLTDFGIAKILDAQGVTSTGQVLGSPAHMAPEQIEGGEVDARTDVFALGVLFYECLVGHLPFEGKNPAQVLRKVLEGSYPEAERERPAVGARWSRILAGALAHDVAARTPSPRALAEQIRAELSELGVAEPRVELAAYFADPAGYAERHVARLVPRLVARAEAGRKRGDVPGAAADYNRALALAPDDLSILKRLSKLNASRSRRKLARRALAVALGSVALGVAAFAIARALSAPPPSPPPAAENTPAAPAPLAPAGIAPLLPAPNLPAVAPGAEPVVAAPRGRGRPHPTPAAPPPSASASATPLVRDVIFQLVPSGAKLVLDGVETTWFGANRVMPLKIGAHTVHISVPNSRCCKPYSGVVAVVAPKPGVTGPQRIVYKLEILPSTVVLSGAPANAQYSCPQIGLIGYAGAPQTVTLNDVFWSGRCQFTPPTPDADPRAGNVTIVAGETNTIAWPPG
ncbi:serine/threonine protein kinase [Sorangium cellulosum]|uniref:Serine/threonine protein kinase n=1 Tax=Sorangium cellulosum TaxID=56 RepID=A0A2L0EXX1_SORCE|nr:serine/threonine-protein kinase [Sorangium cellulosum]AUX44154.1 serine/threonine protein kinase [Sorangium cellulosum]